MKMELDHHLEAAKIRSVLDSSSDDELATREIPWSAVSPSHDASNSPERQCICLHRALGSAGMSPEEKKAHKERSVISILKLAPDGKSTRAVSFSASTEWVPKTQRQKKTG